MKLILKPQQYPRHFAWSERPQWFVKRSPVLGDGTRVYKCESLSGVSRQDRTVIYKCKFLLQFIDLFKELTGKNVLLYQEFEGKLYRICGEGSTKATDTRIYGAAA